MHPSSDREYALVAEMRETIDTWKQWHGEIADVAKSLLAERDEVKAERDELRAALENLDCLAGKATDDTFEHTPGGYAIMRLTEAEWEAFNAAIVESREALAKTKDDA